MGVYKVEKCPNCGYTHNEPKPRVNKSCPKCGQTMAYLPNWYISYQIHGRKHVEAIGPQKRLAEDALGKKRIALRENRYFDKAPATPWTEAVHLFRTYFQTNVKACTARMYENSLRVLNPQFEEYTLDKISPHMVEEFKARRKAQGVENATVNRDLATIKRLFNLAEQGGLLEVNRILKVKQLRENNARLRYLADEEISALLANCSSPHLRLAVQIALNTGLRKEGVLTLKWSEIDFRTKIISKAVKGDKLVHVPLSASLEGILLEHRRSQKILHQNIITFRNRPVGDVKTSFNNACEDAKIKDFHFHDLRHTFASHFLMRTKDLKALQEILGHSDIKMTMRYSHLLNEHKKAAMEKFDRKEALL